VNNDAFDQLTQQILARIGDDDRVLGFVVLGSAAAAERRDEWSDHDFFLITRPGEQEWFRTTFTWIAEADDIAHAVRDTAHGVKVVLANGHLLEFAVFDLDEISLARVNARAVLLDKGEVTNRIEAISRNAPGMRPIGEAIGLFFSHVLVCVGRYRRGEHLAARWGLTAGAVPNLIAALLQDRNLAAPDPLDLTRRIESVLPDEAYAISSALAHDNLSQAGAELLDIADWSLNGHPDFPSRLLDVVRARLSIGT